jgi:recombination protein RecR
VDKAVADYPEPVRQLMAALHRLPGIGPRSAERLALHLTQADPAFVKDLASHLITAREQVHPCPVCGVLTEHNPCAICNDPRRDPGLICVVERATDVFNIEKASAFRGLYHVLGGKISPINGVGPEDLELSSLEKRLQPKNIREVILALGSDVEGDATSHYLAKRLKSLGVRVSQIAQGLPVGSGLEFADELTLSRAIEGRRFIDQDSL